LISAARGEPPVYRVGRRVGAAQRTRLRPVWKGVFGFKPVMNGVAFRKAAILCCDLPKPIHAGYSFHRQPPLARKRVRISSVKRAEDERRCRGTLIGTP